mgnify:CR=1 FL=1
MTFTQYYRLMDVQARMQLRADASKFVLGYLWWFLEPLLWVGVFYVVFNLILDSDARQGVDFLLFLACGKFAFLWFSKTVVQASNSIVANTSLVGKIDVPKSLFPMAAIHESLYRQTAVYLLLALLVVAGGYPVAPQWLWLLPILLCYYLMIVACSFVGAYLVCMVRDFSKFIPLGMTFLLFTSGIFWDVRAIEEVDKATLILQVNPLAFIIDAHRQAILYQRAPDLAHLAWLGFGSGLLALATGCLMRRNGQFLALRVLS